MDILKLLNKVIIINDFDTTVGLTTLAVLLFIVALALLFFGDGPISIRIHFHAKRNKIIKQYKEIPNF